MSYRKNRHRMRTKRSSNSKRRRNTRKRRTGGAGLLPEPRTQIQLFTESEEHGILKKMIDYLNGKPKILDELALPANVKKYIMSDKKTEAAKTVDAAKAAKTEAEAAKVVDVKAEAAKTPKGQLTPDIFKYKIDKNGQMDKNTVLTKREMKSYVFPLLIQLEELFLADAHNLTDDDENKESVKGYHNFTMGLVRSVSNIINPMWFDAIESYLSFINFDKIPGVSSARQNMATLGETISAAMGDKGAASQGVTYNTQWFRGYPDDRNANPDDLGKVSYFPRASFKYTNNDDIADVNQILNSMFYLGDAEQTPIAKEKKMDLTNANTTEKTKNKTTHSMQRQAKAGDTKD